MRTQRNDPKPTPPIRWSHLALVTATTLSACASSSCSGSAAPTEAGPGASGGASSGGAAGAGGSVATGGGSSGGSGGGLVLDGGGATGGSGGGSAGCQKVDFLFVVDNSASMNGEQAQLVAAFPGFISAIQTTLSAGDDIHVLVTDTDEWGRCNTANPWKGMNPSSDLCDTYIESTKFDECDRTRGAGVIHPAGKYASDKLCPFPSGRRWLDGKDADLSANFACAAQVGVAGHPSERPMDSMLAALAPQINATGGCNDGFLRDDALLVVTFISDDPNYEDTGTPQDWYDAVVAAKKGDPKAVVMVGFTPVGCGAASGKINGAHWAELVSKFPNSLQAQVCSTDYVPTFTQAVQLIDDSCDQYVPPVS
jgi:hypothetical protein